MLDQLQISWPNSNSSIQLAHFMYVRAAEKYAAKQLTLPLKMPATTSGEISEKKKTRPESFSLKACH